MSSRFLVIRALLMVVCAPALGAQAAPMAPLTRALDLEQRGRFRDAAAAFREAIAQIPVPAMLGYERVMKEIGEVDTLLAVLDSAIRSRPADPTFRAIQIRTLHGANRRAEERAAFDRWVRDAGPRDAAPYREYARLLLHAGESPAADSVLERARLALGDTREFAVEIAQIRAALGRWQDAANAWRAIVEGAGHLEQSAVFSLTRADSGGRARIRHTLRQGPVSIASRRLLAHLELNWGTPAAAWDAVRELPADTAAVRAWRDVGERAEQMDAWLTARDAFVAITQAQFSIGTAVRAANAALQGEDPATALRFATLAAGRIDSAAAAGPVAPILVRALAEMNRAADAERTMRAYERWLDDRARDRLRRLAAWAWIRAGDIARARSILATAAATEEADEISAWLALYEGDVAAARTAFKAVRSTSPATVRAMAILARTRVERAPALGNAFLTLARGDTAATGAAFERAAASLPEAASVLLLHAAQMELIAGQSARAEQLFARVVTEHERSPDAPEAELAWARVLARRGDNRAAIARLEHLILTYPGSALVPQARRELELLNGRRAPDRT